ncbi:MAG: 50S ribosomal protein L6 [Desulfopila sp.]
MSRIGKQPIPVPAGVKIDIQGQHIVVTGKKGKLERDVRPEIDLVVQDNEILVNISDENNRKVNAFRGLYRSLVNNMVIGVVDGFNKALVIEGVGYKGSVAGNTVTLSVGYSNPVEFKLPKDVSARMEGANKIVLESIDKELLGLTAAQIRRIKKPEPYKGKGIRYEDEHIVRKVGKAGGKK